MTSNMITGERRWASARKAGMTVLGKVTVPKPINLPSQRLENHGLDPNVEIVPKGTHSWGSRPSSSASNAWGSSTLSPNNDGSSSSPSHLSGCPSSGGSGTRPSTAGSDRAHETNASAWGSNSRPSSASGALASNQMSLNSLRPRSAETRPASSQLSRFAEPVSDNSMALSSPGMTEKLGVASSKNDGFSLASGDFPTLGSEKGISGKNMESQDHGSHSRPGSSSCGLGPGEERTGNSVGDVFVNVNGKIGPANSWRRENPAYGEDGTKPGVETWRAEPQPYPNSSIPPQHYDAWHGPPMNNHPYGVWYRGPPGGPPFGSPVAPNGFPMEPFPYYRPQIPPVPLPNPQPVPPPVAGPRAPHPKNGDMYRPHMHDAYIRPGMPIRPGFFPGQAPYEGYYGPRMRYRNSNEPDIPFMGMAVGPAAYDNRYPGQNAPEPSNSHGRPGEYGANGKTLVSEQVESSHHQDARGPFKVLLKQHDELEGKDDEQKWDDIETNSASYPGKVDHLRNSSWDNGWRANHRKDEEIDTRRGAFGEEVSSETVDNQGGVLNVDSSDSVENLQTSNDRSTEKSEHAEYVACSSPGVLEAPKDPSLIQKIEELNAKARASDVKQDVKFVSCREEQKNKLRVRNPTGNRFANETCTGSVSRERTLASGVISSDTHGDKSVDSTLVTGTASYRRSTNGVHARADNRGKGKSSTQESDGWRKKALVAGSLNVASTVKLENSSGACGQEHTVISEKMVSYQGKDDGEFMQPISDLPDCQAQRVKMKELAKQRLQQREKEEEERTRDQKAKALAKLEELNRRTLAGEGSSQKLETAPIGVTQNKGEELSALVHPTVGSKSLDLGSKPNAVAQRSESSIGGVEKSTTISSEVPLEATKAARKEPILVHDQSEHLPLQYDNADADHPNIAPQVHDSIASKQKRIDYGQNQYNSPSEKNFTEKLISHTTTEASKSHTDETFIATVSIEGAAGEILTESSLPISPINPSSTAESFVHHRKKNRSGKNKHKVEGASSAVALPSVLPKDATALETSVADGKPKTFQSVLDYSSGQSQTDSKDVNQSSEKCLSLPNEEAPIRVNNHWKSQHIRRMPRNPQGNKSSEKFNSSDAFIWAPVRSQNKTEVSDEANQKTVIEAVNPSAKIDQQVHNIPRNKRAEMERYVPKPVAKEMAQQGSSHQLVASSMNQITSGETFGGPETSSLDTESSQTSGTSIEKIRSVVEYKNGDGKHNRSGKVHGSWRQRESTALIPKPSGNVQPQKRDLSSGKEQFSNSDEWDASDGWEATVPVVKDQGVTGRGKRQPYKGHRGSGHTHDPNDKINNRGETEKVYLQSSETEVYHADSPTTPKENRAVGEKSTSHWQPKYQRISTNQAGNRSNSGQNVTTDVVRANKKDSIPQGGTPLPPQLEEEAAVVKAELHPDQLPYEKSSVEEASSVGHEEAKKERKIASQKGRPGSPVDDSPLDMDLHEEQRTSVGFRKYGSESSRFGREHESRGDWSGSGKDTKLHNVSANRERQRHNSHYEYQPVGPHNNNKTHDLESPKESSQNLGSRFRERGQNHSRRGGGNFYGRQTAGV